MKKSIISVALLLIVALFVTNIIFPCILPCEPLLSEERYKTKPILSDDEINELRQSYQKYVYIGNPGVDDIIDHDLRWYLNIYDTLVYCEIIGEPKLNMNDPSEYIVPIRVISDTENLLIKNKVIYLEIGWEMLGIIEADIGERFVFMIEWWYLNGARKFRTTLNCAYYVTEDGYVLSAFVEKGQRYTGYNIAKFMKELKKTSEEFEFYRKYYEGLFAKAKNVDGYRGLVGFNNYDEFKERYRIYYTKLNNDTFKSVYTS